MAEESLELCGFPVERKGPGKLVMTKKDWDALQEAKGVTKEMRDQFRTMRTEVGQEATRMAAEEVKNDPENVKRSVVQLGTGDGAMEFGVRGRNTVTIPPKEKGGETSQKEVFGRPFMSLQTTYPKELRDTLTTECEEICRKAYGE